MTGEFPIPDALRSLGTPLHVYPPRAGAGRAGYFTAGTVLALLAGLTVIGIVNPPDNPPPEIVLISVMGVCGMLALICFGMGLFAQTYTLFLFPDALARAGADQPEIFRWSDVREFYSYVNPMVARHRIVAQDGRKLEIDSSVKDAKKLGQTVQQTLVDRMMPAATAAFEKGETLTFGPLRLDQSFLYYKKKRLSWNEVAKMQLAYNPHTRSIHFEVRALGSALLPWCVVKTQDIPNVIVFTKLAERKRAFTK